MPDPFLRSLPFRIAFLLALAAGLGGAAAVSAQDPPEPTARVEVRALEAGQLQRALSHPNGRHFAKMAEELRLLTESRILGTPKPELTTDRVEVTARAGGSMARIGVQHLNTAMVVVAPDGELRTVCSDVPEAALASRTAVVPTAEVE